VSREIFSKLATLDVVSGILRVETDTAGVEALSSSLGASTRRNRL
jgi:hypothetical protein